MTTKIPIFQSKETIPKKRKKKKHAKLNQRSSQNKTLEQYSKKRNLNETNFLSIATKALPAAHQTILANDCVRISADTAATIQNNCQLDEYDKIKHLLV